MKHKLTCVLAALLASFQILATTGCNRSPNSESEQVLPAGETALDSRVFEFKYGAKLVDVPENSHVRVWVPIAESNQQQTVKLVDSHTPSTLQENRDKKYGNQIGFFELEQTDASEIEFSLTYDVIRYESKLDDAQLELTDQQREAFLSSNALVPLDGKPLELIHDVQIPETTIEAGETLYNVVESHMTYDKSQPGYGQGDAVWACDSKTGNCTDFHSLFISLARSQKIPARFEIGFPIPNDATEGKIGGYHCWAWFHVEGKGWSPVDISEADKHPELKDYYFGKLTSDRLALSTGRDIELTPKSNGGPLNYFVYPYVEVDGKQWPQEKIELNFSFQDNK